MIINSEDYIEIVRKLDESNDTHGCAYLRDLRRVLGNILELQTAMNTVYANCIIPLGSDRIKVKQCIILINKERKNLERISATKITYEASDNYRTTSS